MESRRRRMLALGLVLLLAAALQLPLWGWEADDAAIGFAYARSLADGDGLVPQVGAERIEAFASPLWIVIVSCLTRLGLDPFVASRLLGLLFGVGSVGGVYVALRPLQRDLAIAPLAGAFALAIYAPHAIWSASGLESSLFALLLALGCARLAVARDLDALGPLLFTALALTRPEGAAYALVAAAGSMAASRSWYSVWRRGVAFITYCAVPLVAVELLRIGYFAQEFPSVFHARLVPDAVSPLASSGQGWRQLAAFGVQTGSVALFPLAVVGATGASSYRWVSGLVAAVLMLLGAATGTSVPVIIALFALPVLAANQRMPTGLATALLAVGLAFHLGAHGDDLHGFRFLASIGVPLALLVGIGVAELVDRFDAARYGFLIALGLCALPQLLYLGRYAVDARDPAVPAVVAKARVDHYRALGRRLAIDRRLWVLDRDAGGVLFFGGDDVWLRDPRGVADLPLALGGNHPEVLRYELFGKAPIDLAHLDGPDGASIRVMPEFRTAFVAVYGAMVGGDETTEVHVRRALFLEPSYAGSAVPVQFANGVTLLGFDVVSPEVASDGGLFIEVGLDRGPGRPYRLMGFLSRGGKVWATFDLPPGHDWVPPTAWRPYELFHGRFSLSLSDRVREGVYDLGFVMFDAEGAVSPGTQATEPVVLPDVPVFARGEVRVPNAVTVVSGQEMARFSLADHAVALEAARTGLCEEAEQAWKRALRHQTQSVEWRVANRPPVAKAIAGCLARRAASRPRDGEALMLRVAELTRARDWDARHEEVWLLGVPIATASHERAIGAASLEGRFRWAEAAVRADPRRSWDRRLAENARAQLLGP